jgi:hypothetical protein
MGCKMKEDWSQDDELRKSLNPTVCMTNQPFRVSLAKL